MDLRHYYSKIRDVESTITEPYAVIVSYATPDGGKAGVLTETTRHVAAKQVAEGRARLATTDEAAEFHEAHKQVRQDRQEADRLSKLQVVLVPQKGNGKPVKD